MTPFELANLPPDAGVLFVRALAVKPAEPVDMPALRAALSPLPAAPLIYRGSPLILLPGTLCLLSGRFVWMAAQEEPGPWPVVGLVIAYRDPPELALAWAAFDRPEQLGAYPDTLSADIDIMAGLQPQ